MIYLRVSECSWRGAKDAFSRQSRKLDWGKLHMPVMEQPPYAAEPADSPPGGPPAWRQLLDNPWLMLAMLFFVTAALGLPFLWMSRGFSTFWKVVLTVAVLAWTALILWLFWLVMAWAVPTTWEAIQELSR
jgi:hypothetical protein